MFVRLVLRFAPMHFAPMPTSACEARLSLAFFYNPDYRLEILSQILPRITIKEHWWMLFEAHTQIATTYAQLPNTNAPLEIKANL